MMPYLRCMTCGALSYTPRNGLGASCPACGVPVTRPGEAAADPGDPGRRLDHLLRLTRDLLDTDVALLTEIADGREIIRRFDGDWPAGGVFQNASALLEETFCQRMLDGRIGNYIRDAHMNDQVSELAMVRELAEFESLSDQCVCTEEDLRRTPFEPRAVVYDTVALDDEHRHCTGRRKPAK